MVPTGGRARVFVSVQGFSVTRLIGKLRERVARLLRTRDSDSPGPQIFIEILEGRTLLDGSQIAAANTIGGALSATVSQASAIQATRVYIFQSVDYATDP